MRLFAKIPIIGRFFSPKAIPEIEFTSSSEYWEERYAENGNSGAGSYGALAKFKAEVINDFVKNNNIKSVIEFGCGDGNQLSLSKYPNYLGLDVSHSVISKCNDKFNSDVSKRFQIISDFNNESADLVLSLDVIYHLIEDDVFENYMISLFDASDNYVIIYSSNEEREPPGVSHVKHRKFTNWIDSNRPDFGKIKFIKNKYPFDGKDSINTSFADFYIFEKIK
tara:strand:+ start:124 stop:792 length:669 start_codon:yes stop_codon:yes gene_type:complete